MKKNLNKIIFFGGLLILIGVAFWGWKAYQGEKPPPFFGSYNEKTFYLYKKCEVLPDNYLSTCYYSPLREVFPLREWEKVVINGEELSLPIMHSGDLVGVKINLEKFIKQVAPPINFDTLGKTSSLCFKIKPILLNMKIFPQNLVQKVGEFYCFSSISSSKLPIIAFVGVPPLPLNSSNPGSLKKSDDLLIEFYQLEKKDITTLSTAGNLTNFKPNFVIFPAVIQK